MLTKAACSLTGLDECENVTFATVMLTGLYIHSVICGGN